MICKKNEKKFFILLCVIILIGGLLYYFYTSVDMKNSSNNANSKTDSNIDWSIYETNEIELDSSLVITKEGIYVLSGTLENGSIEVNTKGNVKIILDNVNITNKNGPAINVKNAKYIVISTKENSINNLTDGENFSGYDDNINATIYSKDNLILEGDGTLIVNSNNENAIVSCNDLIINNGIYKINASIDALKGKDSVIIKNGVFEINSTGDAIKSTNDKDEEKGYIEISDGIFNITTNSKSDDESAKGIKATNYIIISGGTFNLDTIDDAIHSNNKITISGGIFEIKSNDDAIHADNELLIDNGTINIIRSYEGLEAEKIIINNGNVKVYSSDDGINASSKSDNLATININGGDVYVNSSGDGLDANGSIYISGGVVTVDGPTTDGDGALDYDNELVITNGKLIAVGSAGMAQGISNTSSQYGVLINFDKTYQNGSVITITNSNNEEIMSYTSTKNFSSLCYSNSNLVDGESYQVKINGETVTSLTITEISNIVGSFNNGPKNMSPNGNRPSR